MLPPASTLTPLVYPYTSLMSRRRRRATEPVSSSASMTTRPPTMCRPPEKRSSAVTSALRSEVLVHSTRESSSFTMAVIATSSTPTLPRGSGAPPCQAPFCGVPFRSYRPGSPTVPEPGRPALSLPTSPDHRGQGRRQAHGIVPWCPVERGDGSQEQLRTALLHR